MTSRGNKRQRKVHAAAADDGPSTSGSEQLQQGLCPILALPGDLFETVLSSLDALSLARLNRCCKSLRAYDRQSGLRLVEKIAKGILVEACGAGQADRWRNRSWLERLYYEDCVVGFDVERSMRHGFRFAPVPRGSVAEIAGGAPVLCHLKLDGMGPKLLVSDASTMTQPVLRWRLVVRGNTAVEFGVIPLSLADSHKALHKCYSSDHGSLDPERPVGFCSAITVGSQLPFKVPVMKGSLIEVLARRGRLEVMVVNPPDGQELYWHNTRTVPKPYKGPTEIRFEQDFPAGHHVKLALTCWAYGAFDVLHPPPRGGDLGAPHGVCGPPFAQQDLHDVQYAGEQGAEEAHGAAAVEAAMEEEAAAEAAGASAAAAGSGEQAAQVQAAPQGLPEAAPAGAAAGAPTGVAARPHALQTRSSRRSVTSSGAAMSAAGQALRHAHSQHMRMAVPPLPYPSPLPSSAAAAVAAAAARGAPMSGMSVLVSPALMAVMSADVAPGSPASDTSTLTG